MKHRVLFVFTLWFVAVNGVRAQQPQLVQMASLRPNAELHWQRISPNLHRPDGPVLYQLLFNAAGTPGTLARFDANPRHLTNSLITDNGNMVAIGGLSISGAGLISFAGGQTFPTGSGDVSGAYPSLTVAGLQGHAVAGTAPTTGQVLQFNGTQWAPTTPAAGWLLGGNVVGCGMTTSPCSNFIGSTDNSAVEIHVNGQRAFRVETGPNPIYGTTVNIVGGFVGNYSGSFGATIAGGGYQNHPNGVISDFGTVGGGGGNIASSFATVAGGFANTANGISCTVGGGQGNIAGNSPANEFCTVAGGESNTASSLDSTVGGGSNNAASGLDSTVGGGQSNTASGLDSTVSGGSHNAASGQTSTVSGGANNAASGQTSTVGGGQSNHASGQSSTVAGGGINSASGLNSTVGGGTNNAASGDNSTVAGGQFNTVAGPGSFAAGQYTSDCTDNTCATNFSGVFLWGDNSTTNVLRATAANQFLVRAAGGVNFFTSADLQSGVSFPPSGGNLIVGSAAGVTEFTVDGSGNLNAVGDVNTDSTGANNGTVAHTVKFGGGGEAIGSKRTAGGNQYGLDFYTNSMQRMFIDLGGTVHVVGNLAVGGAITAGTKDFKIDHPLDPENKYLVHASVESSEMKNIYDGVVRLDGKGKPGSACPAGSNP